MTTFAADRLTHSFGSFKAVDDVSLQFHSGEVLALVGENGAGKTTLMRIIAGELRPRSGAIVLDGHEARFQSARQARSAGIEIVHQHLMLVSDFTIAENLALSAPRGRMFYRAGELLRIAEEAIDASGLSLSDPGRRVAELSVGERAKLEIIKAVSRRPRLLILDEPTSVLTPDESAALFELLRRLRAEGTAVVLISHKLPEVFAVSNRIAVLRSGRLISVADADRTDPRTVVREMIGRDYRTADSPIIGWGAAPVEPREPVADNAVPRLRCSGMTTAPRDSGVSLDHVSFEVAAGETVAIIGVAGNGQTELAHLLRGIDAVVEGRIEIDGEPLTAVGLLAQRRVGHIPEDRTRDGVVAEMTIAENLSLAADRWSRKSSVAGANEAVTLFSIRARGISQRAGELSGGNQQKMILARELGRGPSLVVAAEPTRGLDVGAAEFVHERLRAEVRNGGGILLITSDRDEAYALADAVHVMYRGRLTRRMTVAEAMESAGSLMAGLA